jgi:hypothetical protein
MTISGINGARTLKMLELRWWMSLKDIGNSVASGQYDDMMKRKRNGGRRQH